LFKLPSFEASCTTEDLYLKIGRPQMLPVQRLDKQPVGPGVPRYCVPPSIVVTSAEEVVNAEIIIADFGEAFICDADVKLRTPILLLPPESIFKEGLGQAIDVWTAG
jgi:serine/threonine-protein kinase SRPK3